MKSLAVGTRIRAIAEIEEGDGCDMPRGIICRYDDILIVRSEQTEWEKQRKFYAVSHPHITKQSFLIRTNEFVVLVNCKCGWEDIPFYAVHRDGKLLCPKCLTYLKDDD